MVGKKQARQRIHGTSGCRPGSGLRENGFTLIELMIVLTIVAILVSIALPMADSVILRARESVLKE